MSDEKFERFVLFPTNIKRAKPLGVSLSSLGKSLQQLGDHTVLGIRIDKERHGLVVTIQGVDPYQKFVPEPTKKKTKK